MKLTAVILWTVLAAGAVAAMFNITFEVEKLEARLAEVNRQIAREQEAIHVLQAEWSYLNRPQRLETLMRELLPHLAPVTSHQITTFARLPERGAAESGEGAISLAPSRIVPAMHRVAKGPWQ